MNMSVLIAINSTKKVGILPKIAKLFPFRGVKKVTRPLSQNGNIFVEKGRILSKGRPIPWTRFHAAQLRALQIEQINISENANARSLLDRMAKEKAIPESDLITVADLSTREGRIAYVLHPQSHPYTRTRIFNRAVREIREEIFNQLPSKDRIGYVLGTSIYFKGDLIPLLTPEEKDQATKQVVEKLDKTAEEHGKDHIKMLTWLGKNKEPEIAERIQAYTQRHQELMAQRIKDEIARTKAKSEEIKSDEDDEPPEDGGTPQNIAGIPGAW
jgi:hypothetical protein